MRILSLYSLELSFIVMTISWKPREALGKVIPVGVPITADQLTSLCKFDKVSNGYNVCQKVTLPDGSPDYMVTTTLDMMCDAVKEALGFQCARCLTMESPEGSNTMVDTCALSSDCAIPLDNETVWMYLTTQKLAVEVPSGQKCVENDFKTLHEDCTEKKTAETLSPQ
uniref:Uncharacterized protein n=1 Tax=Cacopsylla melanoneura TaxID=428564 RepID=A0A8D8WEU5_9HEMI